MPDQDGGERQGGRGEQQALVPLGLTHRGLDIQVLGTPALSLDGQPTELSGKSLALVCYLALEGETRRAVLADLLWTDAPEDAGRRNLRRELHRLRATAVGDWLEAHGERLSLRSGYSLDLHEFHRLLQQGRSAAAAALLRGPLLDGLYPPSAEGFTDWREARGAELTEVQLSALSVWAAELGQEGKQAAAQEVCARMLRLDPLREQTHRQLMELLHQSGEQGAALARYRALESLLARELGVEPLPQTTLLYRQILEGAPSPGAAALPEQPNTSPLHLPLVGRAQALQTLARSRVVLVTGEAGVGKTRLIREFLGQAHSTVLQGSPEAALLPFAPIAALFVNRPGLLDRLEESARAAVGRLLPGLEQEPGGALPVIQQPLSQQTLTLALTAALQTVVGQGVLVVEDLHWLDAPTLGVVTRLILGAEAEDGAAADREASGRVIPNRVLFSARPAELAARPELVAVLGHLERQSGLTRLPLRELGAAEVERLIARLSGQEAPLFSRRLYQATAGHPLFLLETLRSLRESGELHTESGLWQTRYDQDTVDYAEIPIPQSVRAAVLLRVSRLGDAARRLLHAAAVAGEPFGASLHSVCGLSEWEALELLEAAEQAHLICPVESGGSTGGSNPGGNNPGRNNPEAGQGGYRFGHDLYRHALLLDVTEARRRLIHRQLGRLLEAQGQFAQAQGQPSSTQSPQAQAGHPARIASHFEQAGEWRSAWLHWQEAARRSAQVYDHAGALAHYARALHCLPQQGPEDLRHAYGLHLASSELLRHLGDEPGRLRALCQMRGLAHSLNDLGLRAEVAARLANYHTEHDDYGEAARTAQEALQDLGPHLDADRRSALMVEAGAALACMEDFAAATEALTPALELVRGVNPARHANVLYWLGHCAAQQQDWQGALEHYTRSVRELPPERPTRGRVLTLWKLGQMQARLGRADEAALTFRQADADALTLNATPLRALCLSDLGLLLLNGGEHAEARRLLREAETCCGQDQEGLEAVATLREGLNAVQMVQGL